MPYENHKYSQSRLRRRFFSGSGRFVGGRNLPHAFGSFFSAVSRKAFNIHPQKLFIPYSAAAALQDIISSSQVVVEVGAGMSTLWLASRVGKVVSFEWDPEWYGRIKGELARQRLSNVDLRLCEGHEQMGFRDVKESSVDLAFIDGGPRSLCLRNLWRKVKPGGFFYLDNWDSDLFWLEGGCNARQFIVGRSEEIASLEIFIDYVPAYVNVCEGLIIQKKK